MYAGRTIKYINIGDPASLNKSSLVKKGFAEITRALSLFDHFPGSVSFIPVQYIWSDTSLKFYRIVGWEDRIEIEQLPATMETFQELYRAYNHYFVRYDPNTFRSFQGNEMAVLKKVWERVFNFFIPSINVEVKPKRPLHFLVSMYPVNGEQFIFDLAAIFDLQFRFFLLPQNIPIYAVTVAGAGLAEFAENLVVLFKPLISQTLLLYGFKEHYNEQAICNESEEIRSLALDREILYSNMLENAKKAGVTVIDLECDEDLFAAFRKEKEGYFIQIVTHYIHSVEVKEKRLLYKESSIRYDIFEFLLKEMKEQGLMRKDVILDAVTCSNFFDFKSLYSIGIRYLLMSLHDFDTDQAAIVLNELYTGVNASKLGWNPNYLDGTRYFHEARSNVYRCFYTLEKMGHPVNTSTT